MTLENLTNTVPVNSICNKTLPKFTSIDTDKNIHQILESYHSNGIIYLENYINEAKLEALINEIDHMQKMAEEDIKNNWNDEIVCFYSKNQARDELDKKEYCTEPYFQESKNKAHIFYENFEGKRHINRIGHGMHFLNEYKTMHELTYHNNTLTTLLKTVGYKRPICQLSVYIPKYPNGIGSDVRPHQESTFAYTEPQTVVVVWIALEEAFIENACMWGILGSNHWPLHRVSLVDHVNKTRTFKKMYDYSMPDYFTEREYFTPLEVKKGDALFFHGNFVHCSPINNSTYSRKALSQQFIDTFNVHYPSTNWLQPVNNKYIYDISK